MLCNICPRKCNIDRKTAAGVCSVGEKIKVSRAALHFYEEPCISGENGSGTVFFSGCNLKCVYCQNYDISRGYGKEISVNRLAEIFLELQQKGAENINLVTPDHYVFKIKEALDISHKNGLKIPIVYNTSGYCSKEALEILKDDIDIFLTDFKYISSDLAQKYSFSKDYPSVAKEALQQMFSQVGKCEFSSDGMMKKGIIVRHLCLPSYKEDTKQVIKYLYETYKDDIIISIMNQFTPMNLGKYPEINRKLTDDEYDEIIDYALSLGVENAFIQEGDTADESFIPDFSDFCGV